MNSGEAAGQAPDAYRRDGRRPGRWLVLPLLGLIVLGAAPDRTIPALSGGRPAPGGTGALPQQCAPAYAAVLEIAALARRYGADTGFFVDALAEMADRLNACLDEAARPGAGRLLMQVRHSADLAL